MEVDSCEQPGHHAEHNDRALLDTNAVSFDSSVEGSVSSHDDEDADGLDKSINESRCDDSDADIGADDIDNSDESDADDDSAADGNTDEVDDEQGEQCPAHRTPCSDIASSRR